MNHVLTIVLLALSMGTAMAQLGQGTTRATPGASEDGVGQPTGGSGLAPKDDGILLPGSIALQPASGSAGQTHIPGVSANGLPPHAGGATVKAAR